MAEVTQNAAVGDKLVLELHVTLKAKDMEGVDLTVEAAVPDGYEINKDAKEPQMLGGLNATDAMMTPTSMMVQKKGNKGVGPNTPT
jgi:hypothetical protein